MRRGELTEVFERLLAWYGEQHWWPGESALEVIAGAVLTQNTAWRNVEHAIANLKRHGMLSLERLCSASKEELARLIRPAGYYNVKAERLQSLMSFIAGNQGIEGLSTWSTVELRKRLLGIRGVGRETADSILLYAFGRPVFVVDSYTRRVFTRLGAIEAGLSYDEIQSFFQDNLPRETRLYNEYHALIVRHAKDRCRKRNPRCDPCPLSKLCPSQYSFPRLGDQGFNWRAGYEEEDKRPFPGHR